MSKFWRLSAAITALVGAIVVTVAGMTVPSSAAIVHDQWQSLGGVITGAPDVAQLPDGTLLYFATGADQAVWVHEVDPDGNSVGWSTLGGVVKGGVGASNAIVSGDPATGRVDVFAIGTDNAVWSRTFVGAVGTWGPWTSHGGIATSDPTAMAFGDPDAAPGESDFVLEIFVRGTDGALWNKTFNGGPVPGWSAWGTLGGILKGGPGAGGNPLAFIGNIAVRGADDAVWYMDYINEDGVGLYSEWFTVGGVVNEDPEGEYLCTATFFARGLDNGIWTQAIDPDTGWQPLGGVARSGPGTHEMVFLNDDDTADWVVAVRGNNNGLWTRRHTWYPDDAHCNDPASAGSAGADGGETGPNRKPPRAAG